MAEGENIHNIHKHTHAVWLLGLLRFGAGRVLRFQICEDSEDQRVIRVEDPTDLWGGEEIPFQAEDRVRAAEGLSLSSAGPSSF